MPTYTFKRKSTNKKWTDFMSIAERDELLKDPDVEQLIVSALSIGDPIRLGIKKPDDGFRDVLREVKKAHPKGGGVNTF